MKIYLEKLISQEDLTREETKSAIDACFQENITDAEIAAFLTALRIKGETAAEVTGIAEIIQSKSTIQSSRFTNVMDNCGTGGDRSNSFNISTTAAFVIAGAGIKVAKHGNRSISSSTGSADVLEHLGISLSFTQEQVEELLAVNNIAFLFAQHVHQSLKRITKVRKELALPTIMNSIGPLTNPVSLDSQLLGVYNRKSLLMMANALHQLERKRALVLNGAGYMDEASLAGENHFALLDQGEITEFILTPEDVGLPRYPLEAIRGGSTEENAKILINVLSGKTGAHLDTVLFNAGLGIYANGAANSIIEGIEMARESINSGAAIGKLQTLIKYSRTENREVV